MQKGLGRCIDHVRQSVDLVRLGRENCISDHLAVLAPPDRLAASWSTQAGEVVREEVEHVREGKHGRRSTFVHNCKEA